MATSQASWWCLVLKLYYCVSQGVLQRAQAAALFNFDDCEELCRGTHTYQPRSLGCSAPVLRMCHIVGKGAAGLLFAARVGLARHRIEAA